MEYKQLADVRYLVVHCSATAPTLDIGVQEIDLQHRQRGSFMIGYHFVIRRNGRMEIGRDVTQPGAHAPRYNQCSIGICVVGGSDAKGDEQNNFTPAQLSTLHLLLTDLRVKFPRAEIIGYRDLPRTVSTSPSFDVIPWLATVEPAADKRLVGLT
jgi:N-acetylmuramoyl-L-alanine amidase